MLCCAVSVPEGEREKGGWRNGAKRLGGFFFGGYARIMMWDMLVQVDVRAWVDSRRYTLFLLSLSLSLDSSSFKNFRFVANPCRATSSSPNFNSNSSLSFLHSHSIQSTKETQASSAPRSTMQKRPARLVDILLALDLILSGEVVLAMLPEPGGHLAEFLAHAVDGLLVHVCLGDEFGHGDWNSGILARRALPYTQG